MNPIIKRTKAMNPLIHHITNDVVVNFTANGVLAFGASPIMAKEITEVAEMATIADGLLLNIGTATQAEIDAMELAGKAANKKGIPIVLDPVGVGASTFRQQAVSRLLQNIHITTVKGNAGEIAFLAGITLPSRGVDAAEQPVEILTEVAIKAAQKLQTLIIVTGKYDIITDGKNTLTNETGHAILTKITGAGCLLGSIITATLAANQAQTNSEAIDIVHAALQFYGRAAEIANNRSSTNGPGTFSAHFLDSLQGESTW